MHVGRGCQDRMSKANVTVHGPKSVSGVLGWHTGGLLPLIRNIDYGGIMRVEACLF